MPAHSEVTIGTRSLLSLRFAADRAGRTTLVESKRDGCLHIQRLMSTGDPGDSVATAMLINRGAGLFEGDVLRTHVVLEQGVQLALRTPTITRVHAMREGHAANSVSVEAARATYLEFLPNPTLLCGCAALNQRIAIDLEGGAVAAVGDVWSFGRAAHGERHAYRDLVARTDVHIDGMPILAERLDFRAGRDRIEAAAYGSLHLVGADGAEEILLRTREIIGRAADVAAGASLLPRQSGVAVRAMGDSPRAVHALLAHLMAMFRASARPLASACPRPSGEGYAVA